jgi:hypothetical protein
MGTCVSKPTVDDDKPVDAAQQPAEGTQRKIASWGPEADARARAKPRRYRPQVAGKDGWPAQLTKEEQASGEAAGTLLRGSININRNNPHQAYVSVPGRAQDILIDSKPERNRALHGDTVLVELIEPAAAAAAARKENRRPRDRVLGIVRAVIPDPARPAPWVPGLITMRGRGGLQFQPLDNRFPLVSLPKLLLDACPEAKAQAASSGSGDEDMSGRCTAFKATHSQWQWSDQILLFETGRSFCRGKRRHEGGTWSLSWEDEGDVRRGSLTLAWKGWDAEILTTTDGGRNFAAAPKQKQTTEPQQGNGGGGKGKKGKRKSAKKDYSFSLELLLPGQERASWLSGTLKAFAGDGTGGNAKGELVMPSSLDANQRRKCHALAHGMALGHESRGDGTGRQIFLWRGSKPEDKDAKPDKEEASSTSSALTARLPEWIDTAAAAAEVTIETDDATPAADAEDVPTNCLYAVQLQLPWPRNQAIPTAAELRCLGPSEELAPHLEAAAMNHGIPAEVLPLTPALEAECAVRDILTESEMQSRRDFRSESVFSIDPAGAKDLDDAL